MTNSDKREELKESIKSAFHRIRTRSLRDAPVYLSHVNEAEHEVAQLIDAYIAAMLEDVIGEDEPYVPGNPLLGKLAPRRKENVDADNELRAAMRQRAAKYLPNPTKKEGN